MNEANKYDPNTLPPAESRPLNRRERRAAASQKRRVKPRGPIATNVNPLAGASPGYKYGNG